MQSLGLVSQYKTDAVTKKWVKRIAVLPLVPPDLTDEAFLLLHEEAPDVQPQKIRAFHDYVVDTYLEEDSAFPT